MFRIAKRRLQSKPAASLPVEFFRCCAQHFGIQFHIPMVIGVRSSQIRGLYTPVGHDIAANTMLATIPLEACVTGDRLADVATAAPHVTVDVVREAITLSEFRPMATQLHMAIQLAHVISKLPDRTRQGLHAEEDAAALQGGLAPWARIVDDEDFNEQFVFEMYGTTLDVWQRKSYNEMVDGLGKVLHDMHYTLKFPFPLTHLRRITRLVLARCEHFPTERGHFERGKLMRLWQKLMGGVQQGTPCLVPLLDLVNHSNRPNLGIRVGRSEVLGGRGAITLHSLMPIEGGQELCRHYNFAITRPAALFRYGFLPFDLISVVDHSAIDEHLVKGRELHPEAPDVLEKRKTEDAEVARLQGLFRQARSGQ